MSAERACDYIAHMAEAAGLACSYVEGWGKAAFLADKRTQQAVIMNIVIIGEAASKLINEAPEFVSQHPQLPWKSMRGMRNRVAHGYFDIDLDVVWDTVALALPELLNQLRAITPQAAEPGASSPPG